MIFDKNIEIEKAAFIGAGNVAWHLAQALDGQGIRVCDVYSRELKNAQKLTKKLYESTPTNSLDFSESEAELFIIAVPDKAIPQVAGALILPSDNVILVHTSGSQPLSVLEKADCQIGVFYPLQTFSKKKKVKFPKIPFFIEAQEPLITDKLVDVAGELSSEVYEMNSEERKKMHIAAIFACNFTNHLLTIAKDILKKGTDLDFEILKPLVKETITKSLLIGSENAQTGPAARKDDAIINEHLEILESSPQYREIYAQISAAIRGNEPENEAFQNEEKKGEE